MEGKYIIDGFPERFQTAMRRQKITREQLEELTGINRHTITTYARGSSMPSSYLLRDICTALHTSADYLLGINKKKRGRPPKKADKDVIV